MSIQNPKGKVRYAVVVRSRMEIPLVKWNNLSLEETISFFHRKTLHTKSNMIIYREYMNILKILEISQSSNVAKLEKLYQKNYQLFIVLSFGNEDSAILFENSIPSESLFRYAVAIDIPMSYSIQFPASTLGLICVKLKMTTQYTNSGTFRKELIEARNLLNLAYKEFKGVEIETMYQENLLLTMVFSFQNNSDRKRFLDKCN